MIKLYSDNSVEQKHCITSDFVLIVDPAMHSITYRRDITILLNAKIAEQLDPIQYKQAIQPRLSKDIYKGLSDSQLFDTVKSRYIQQSSDVLDYCDALRAKHRQISDELKEVQDNLHFISKLPDSQPKKISE